MAGGGGWRLELGTSGGGGGGGGRGGVRAGSPAVDGGRGGMARQLAVADVVTAVTLADVLPGALVPRLPTQLQYKWELLYRAMFRVSSACARPGDRAALLAVADLNAVVCAIWKSLVTLPLLTSHPGASPSHLGTGPGGERRAAAGQGAADQGLGAACPPAAQLLTWAEEAASAGQEGSGGVLPIVDMSVPLDEVAVGGVDLQRLALARINALREWAMANRQLWADETLG
ncbi:hypothetical protein V8C86DRAFT_2935185 [Haematococcus lacustris]